VLFSVREGLSELHQRLEEDLEQHRHRQRRSLPEEELMASEQEYLEILEAASRRINRHSLGEWEARQRPVSSSAAVSTRSSRDQSPRGVRFQSEEAELAEAHHETVKGIFKLDGLSSFNLRLCAAVLVVLF
jgi:hypothetical protein